MEFLRSFLRRHFAGMLSLASGNVGNVLGQIRRFHSRGQPLCNFIGAKESSYMRKEFNYHRIGLLLQHPPFSLFCNTNMAAVASCENALYRIIAFSF